MLNSKSTVYRPRQRLGIVLGIVSQVVWTGGWGGLLIAMMRSGAPHNLFLGFAIFAGITSLAIYVCLVWAIVSWMRPCEVENAEDVAELLSKPACRPDMVPTARIRQKWKADDVAESFAQRSKVSIEVIAPTAFMVCIAVFMIVLLVISGAGGNGDSGNPIAIFGVMLPMIVVAIAAIFAAIDARTRRTLMACRIEQERCVLEDAYTKIVVPRRAMAAVQLCLWLRKEYSRQSAERSSKWCLELNVAWQRNAAVVETKTDAPKRFSAWDNRKQLPDPLFFAGPFQRTTLALVYGNYHAAVAAGSKLADLLNVPIVNHATHEDYIKERVASAKRPRLPLIDLAD